MPGVLSRLLEGLLALTGLTAESLIRDAGWRFMDAGRRIERALHVTALLRATVVQERPVEVDELVVESVLVAAESIITFRRRHPGRAGVAHVLDLLVTDRENPRSIAYQADRLHEDLTVVADLLDGQQAEAVRDALLAVVGPIRQADTAALALAGGDGFRDGLDALLVTGGEGLADLATALESAHFAVGAAPQPYSLSGAVSW